MKEKKKYLILGGIILLAIIFFSYSPIITWDSSHYLWLADLLSPNDAFSNWAMSRGIVFPLIVYLSNILIGKNADGLLILMFLFYLAMLGFSYLILRDTNKEMKLCPNNKKRIFFIIAIMVLIVFNPIVYGYYHVLLTEFVAVTLGVITCYLSWKWLQCDFIKSKAKYILYTLFFGFTTVFAWHLKQPYVSAGLFPVIIAAIISICRNFNWKNILQRSITVLFCLILLFVSLAVWNKVLEIGKVKISDDKKTSGFINRGILCGINQLKDVTEIEIEEDPEDKLKEMEEEIEETEKEEPEKELNLEAIEELNISEKDKEEINKIINQESEYKSYRIYQNNNAKGKDMVLFSKSETQNFLDCVKFYIKTAFTTPTTIIKSYLINYLSMIDVFDITFDGISPIPSTEINLFGAAEHETIAFNIFNKIQSNTFYVKKSLRKYQEPFVDNRQPITSVNTVLRSLEISVNFITKIAFLILPIMLVITIIKSIKQRKEKNNRKNNIYNLLIILLSFSFLHVLLHVVLGAPIDRYTTPAMIPMFLAYIIIVFSGIYRKKHYTK